MFRNSYQRGFISIFYSAGSKPLGMWETHLKDGYVARFLDPELKALVFEICGLNTSTAYMICPKNNKSLGIHMPFMILIVKNLKKYFSFEVTIKDEEGFKRRFRVSNFQSTTTISPHCTAMPIGLSDGWNQIQFNLADFTRRAYGKNYMEAVRVKVNANIRLRRIYFADRLLPDCELPDEYRLFIPLSKKVKQPKALEGNKENIQHPSKVVSEIDNKTGTDKRLSQEHSQKIESQQPQRQSLTGKGSKIATRLSPSTSKDSKEKIVNESTHKVIPEILDEEDDHEDKNIEDTQLKEIFDSNSKDVNDAIQDEEQVLDDNQEEIIETNEDKETIEDNVRGEDDVGTTLETTISKDTQLTPGDTDTVYVDSIPGQEEENN